MFTINPYLNFNGNTEEALNFYKSVFGGEFTSFQKFKETPDASKLSAEDAEKIIHISFPVGNTTIMATDAMESMGQHLIAGNNFSLSINTTDEAEAKTLFDKLAVGGKVDMPLEKAFWGAIFGMLTDKFGVQWLVNCDLSPQK